MDTGRSGKRHATSQEEIDSVINDELRGIRFSTKPRYNPRIRTPGKMTARIVGGKVVEIRVEIGKQVRPERSELIDSLIHEEMEARIVRRSYDYGSKRFTALLRSGDARVHSYISGVIRRFVSVLARRGVVK